LTVQFFAVEGVGARQKSLPAKYIEKFDKHHFIIMMNENTPLRRFLEPPA
jgi:hypothetical protein